MKFSAVIFDLDGTIVKSEREWATAFAAVLNMIGIDSKGIDIHTRGVSVKSDWENILAKYKPVTDKTLEELETLTFIEYTKLIPQVTLNDGVLEFMDVLRESGLPLALATSTNWEITEKILEDFDLKNFFECITTGEEVENPKPAPDIFLKASEKLGIDPIDCLAIEDSTSGITAAKEAGMKVIAVSGNVENQDKLDGSDLIVESFPEITLKAIDAITYD